MRNITSSHPHKTRLARRYYLRPGGLLAATLGGILMGPLILACPRAPQKPDGEQHAPFAPDSQSIRPYADWASREVAYIITEEEKAQFATLKTDSEREAFIREFWERRNPNLGSPENKFKEQFYKRVDYAKQHFHYLAAGPRDDRAKTFILYGPPDEIESPVLNPKKPTSDETAIKERWIYKHIDGLGEDVQVEFADPSNSGDFRMVTDPESFRRPTA